MFSVLGDVWSLTPSSTSWMSSRVLSSIIQELEEKQFCEHPREMGTPWSSLRWHMDGHIDELDVTHTPMRYRSAGPSRKSIIENRSSPTSNQQWSSHVVVPTFWWVLGKRKTTCAPQLNNLFHNIMRNDVTQKGKAFVCKPGEEAPWHWWTTFFEPFFKWNLQPLV